MINNFGLILLMGFTIVLSHLNVKAQTISTFAGNGNTTFSGDGGPATSAGLHLPTDAVFDGNGNLLIVDHLHYCIRKVDVNGVISTVAGQCGVGGFGGDGGPATSARFNNPTNLAVDSLGNIYITDLDNHRVRKIEAATGIITTVAGTTVPGFSGDGGQANASMIARPYGVAVNQLGDIFFAEFNTHRVRKIDVNTGVLTTVAGSGTAGSSGDGGPATSARLNNPTGIEFDSNGNLFIADYNNHRVRRVDAVTGTITTIAGTGVVGFSGDGGSAAIAQLNHPIGVATDSSGVLFISDHDNHCIRKVVGSIISTVAGIPGISGYNGDGGLATGATLGRPVGITTDANGSLLIADHHNNRIRKVIFNSSPLADAGPDQTLEATSPSATQVTLDATNSLDPDNDTLTYEWRDTTSNLVATTATPSLALSLGTHTFTLTVDDGHGATATDSVTIIVRDTVAPSITITAPAAATYLLNQSVLANYSCTDTGSDLVTCTGNVPNGGAFDTQSVGTKNFNVSATDAAGNASNETVTYDVAYGIHVLFDQSRAAKSGSTIPIKIQLVDAVGTNLSSLGLVVHAVSVIQISNGATTIVEDAGQSNADFDFRFDANIGGTGGYIFNLKTTGYGTGTYLLNFTVGGNATLYSVQFQVRQ